MANDKKNKDVFSKKMTNEEFKSIFGLTDEDLKEFKKYVEENEIELDKSMTDKTDNADENA